jgi:hypothetical protein
LGILGFVDVWTGARMARAGFSVPARNVAVALALAMLSACEPETGGHGQLTRYCDGLVVSLPGVSDGHSAAPSDDVWHAESRSLIQCATVEEWVSAASQVDAPRSEDALLLYLEELCSRPENSNTPVCRDREHSSLAWS